MKIKLLSDLHFENNGMYEYASGDEELLILAGDISDEPQDIEDFFNTLPKQLHVIYVPGNHEFYRHEYHKVKEKIRLLDKRKSRFHFLDNDHVRVGDVLFYGGTMRTSLSPPEEMSPTDQYFFERFIKGSISDFHFGSVDGRAWAPMDHIDDFDEFKTNLKAWKKLVFPLGLKKVVISHFIPTPKHNHPKFDGSSLTPYFVENMEKYMKGIDLWVHGHGHDPFDTMVKKTRVVSNPLGYPFENNYGFDPDLILEI